ncbi:general odorant-binding protein 19d-like isoform X2 [Cimex lectularius]|nr:general odorant-binding protein 19d-like isoform X2 [Cimex lectularius]
MMDDIAECKNSTNISDDEMTRIAEKKLPETPEGKCMIFCIMQKFDLVDEEGKMNVAGMKAMSQETPGMTKDDLPKLDAVMDQCDAEVATKYKPVVEDVDKCENACTVSECVVRKSKEAGIKDPTAS